MSRFHTWLLLPALLVPNTVEARAVCSVRGVDARNEVQRAELIVVAEILAVESESTLPTNHDGIPDRVIRVRVTRAISANVSVGDEVRLRWRGFSEPRGRRVGGCRVPDEASIGSRVLVVASREGEELVVPNRSVSSLEPNDALIRRSMAQWRSRRGS